MTRNRTEESLNIGMIEQQAAQGSRLSDECCSAAEEIPLIEQLKTERARISHILTMRIKELDASIRMLENSDAETIIKEARNTLNK